MQNLKFYWNGIRHNGELYSGSWSMSGDGQSVRLYLSSRGYRINAYALIPDFNYDGATQKNDSDGMTDYFETTTVIFSGELLAPALEALKKAEEHYAAKNAKRMAKANA